MEASKTILGRCGAMGIFGLPTEGKLSRRIVLLHACLHKSPVKTTWQGIPLDASGRLIPVHLHRVCYSRHGSYSSASSAIVQSGMIDIMSQQFNNILRSILADQAPSARLHATLARLAFVSHCYAAKTPPNWFATPPWLMPGIEIHEAPTTTGSGGPGA